MFKVNIVSDRINYSNYANNETNIKKQKVIFFIFFCLEQEY